MKTKLNTQTEKGRDLVFRTDSHGPCVYTLKIYTCPVSTRLYVRCSNTRRRWKSRKKRVFIIYTRVYIHYDDVRLFSLHSWWVYYITGPSITSAINAVFIINMLIVFCGTPKNSENGVEPKFLLWIQGTNKRWTAGRTAGVWPEECVSGGRYVFGRKSFVSGGRGGSCTP